MMPKSRVRRLPPPQRRSGPALMPVILAPLGPNAGRVTGLEAGADEYFRSRSTRRSSSPGSTPCCGSRHPTSSQPQARQLAEWNATLERRVQEQVAELEPSATQGRFLAEARGADRGGRRRGPPEEPPARGHRRLSSICRFHRFRGDLEPEELMPPSITTTARWAGCPRA